MLPPWRRRGSVLVRQGRVRLGGRALRDERRDDERDDGGGQSQAKESWNADAVGTCIPFCTVDRLASTAPTTAAAMLVPRERNRAFSPFEAPVSLCGTERMMSIGMDA